MFALLARLSMLATCRQTAAHNPVNYPYLVIVALALVLCRASLECSAQTQSEFTAEEAAKRLQRGVENSAAAEREKNKYRGGVESFAEVEKNMKALFKPILSSGPTDSKIDKWYSPHLRDAKIDLDNRIREATIRAETVPQYDVWRHCTNIFAPPIFAACPAGFGYPCIWHGELYGPHRPIETCYGPPTTVYRTLITDTSFKACCVQKGDAGKTSEEILADERKRDGSGWAGLYEYYFPTAAVGWENDRTTTMIATKSEVNKCVSESKKILEDSSSAKANKWVAEAIKRNLEKAGGATQGSAKLSEKVASDLKDVRPEDPKLRLTDSLQNEGLTMRPNFPALDPQHRKLLARRFCMHERQFDKLMTEQEDLVQLGGGLNPRSLQNIPIWSNYCKEGVDLMTDPEKSRLINIDTTIHTDFIKGIAAWEKDPLYCQRMNLSNPNMDKTRIGEVIRKSGPGGILGEGMIGYTCRSGDGVGNVNGGLVPVTFGRHAAVERRTAISDHVLGFIIAGGLAEGMRKGQQSHYKRFEPMPYSRDLPDIYKLFVGKKVSAGAGTSDELGIPCVGPQVGGEDFESQMMNKSDRLFISDYTHKPFTQDIIEEKVDKSVEGFDRYVQDWSKGDQTSKDNIAQRGLDQNSQNYAATFRIFATCPAGFERWKPDDNMPGDGLRAQLDLHCGEEWFGGMP